VTATDGAGVMRSLPWRDRGDILAVRPMDLQSRNLVVCPSSSTFGGPNPKAIRAIAQFLKSARPTVAAFYLLDTWRQLSATGRPLAHVSVQNVRRTKCR
jgi:hypothetical protein